MITKIFYTKFIYLLLCCNELTTKCIKQEEKEAKNFLMELNKKAAKESNKLKLAEWTYNSNITDKNLQNYLDVSAEIAASEIESWKKVVQFDYSQFSDDLRRQFQHFSVAGMAALPKEKYDKLNKIISDMEAIYSTTKIFPRHIIRDENGDMKRLDLDPDMIDILATSRDPEELKYVWVMWRDEIGSKCRALFQEYVELSNEGARLNNFSDYSEYLLKNYEDPDFKNEVEKIWQQLKPLYLQLHAYVRTKLKQKYGDIISEDGPIPVHLLGNMWGQSWDKIADFTLPYPEVKDVDLTAELRRQNYTPLKIFRAAEAFYKSINLTEMPDTFWNNSILEKPHDKRNITCHASAWDFDDGKDFRIKQCTQITEAHYFTAHHEMGHIEYFLQYKDQPFAFRKSANDGFHEAIGDLIAVSVKTPKHLKEIGLLPNEKSDPRQILNSLFKVGLSEIAFMPYGYLIDLWRWDVFSGKTKANEYNCKWWELREKYQGVEPPTYRNEQDFDPAGKYHIIADVEYLRYFISVIIQYQFHRALCEKAGQYNPNDQEKQLHTCDIYKSTVAGNILKKMLAMGSSRPWPEALEVVTGQRNMDATAVLDYYKPLQQWLEKENEKNNAYIGWKPSEKICGEIQLLKQEFIINHPDDAIETIYYTR